MNRVCFAGPSLYGHHRVPGVTMLPPVAAGDLWAAFDIGGPAWFHIIDGVFGEAQAVTVREIREVIAQGATVTGSTSLGALRAVECAPLGMRGIGGIYAEYAEGSRWDDADLGLLHHENGRPMTIAAVDTDELGKMIGRIPGAEGHGCGPGEEVTTRARAVHFTLRTIESVTSIVEAVMEKYPWEFRTRVMDLVADRQAWGRKSSDARAAVRLVAESPGPTSIPERVEICLPSLDRLLS